MLVSPKSPMSPVHRRSGAERCKPDTFSFPTAGAAPFSESAIQGDVLGSPPCPGSLLGAQEVCRDEAMLGLCKFLFAQVSGILTSNLQKAIRNLILDTSTITAVLLSQVSLVQKDFWGRHPSSLVLEEVGCSVVSALL